MVCLTIAPHAGAGGEVVPELELTQAWSVEGPDRFDASGLAGRDGEMYAVSDRHVDTIFRFEFAADVARAVPCVTFTGPDPYPWIGYMDLEGIAVAPDGGFFLAPEWGFAVCHVPAGGGLARWVTPDVKSAGMSAGLFATKDGFVEGIAVLGDGHFLLAAERGPRGVIEISGGLDATRVTAQRMVPSRYPLPEDRGTDWAELATWRGRVFALARNQHLVVELERSAEGGWGEGQAWSYGATEKAAPHRFTDMSYGWAEGLLIDDASITVLLDSNNLDREGRPGDKRSWLFRFKNVIPR